LPDEATLLERIRQCDTAALAQVYDDYYDRIYRYIYGYVGQVGAAEDLTANVFFRLLRAVRDGNSPRSNLPAWLYRVAHNLVVDAFRRKPPEQLELAEWLESDEPDPSRTAEQRMQLERVRLALRQLTEGQQQVIMLKFFQGMDSREVASIMDRSEGAVDALQHRGLRALRKVLQQKPGPGANGDAGSEQSSSGSSHRNMRDKPTSMIAIQKLQRTLELILADLPCSGSVRSLARIRRDATEKARLPREVQQCQLA
jgi:RNA polymerase sigma-70 factor (ECF subfamily)